MKTIALLPCKNEIDFLPSYINSISKVSDMLIVVDDQSVDQSRDFLEIQDKIPCTILEPKKERGEDWSVDKIRQQLLDEGRRQGGTHFICLDADECFTETFSKKCPDVLKHMQPGQKIQMQWLAMWKSTTHYREDASVWSNNFKDFIFCDDGKSNFISEAYFCEPRTPGENNDSTLMKLNPKYGAVMHFQFSFWKKFQLKQCWYRCRELVHGKNVNAINEKFRITLDDPNVYLCACPEDWIPNVMPSIEDFKVEKNWHYLEIKELFRKHGKEFFSGLDIWHVQEIKKLSIEHQLHN
jgi:hypothetical protein